MTPQPQERPPHLQPGTLVHLADLPDLGGWEPETGVVAEPTAAEELYRRRQRYPVSRSVLVHWNNEPVEGAWHEPSEVVPVGSSDG